MEGLGFSVFVIAVVAVYGAAFSLSSAAKKTDETQSKLSPQRVREVVDEAFGAILWKDVPGPGTVNKQRRALANRGPVISIDIEPVAGGSRVAVWMSRWYSRVGMTYFAGAALRQKRKVLKRLEAI